MLCDCQHIRSVEMRLCCVAALFFLSLSAYAQINLTRGQPIGVGGSSVLDSSALYWDASQFSGATLDIVLNTANAYAITGGGGQVDARALGGSQSIGSEVDIGELQSPSVMVGASGGLTAGTYKFVYTLTSPSSTETPASMETSVVTSGCSTNCSFTITSPTYSGSATSWAIYMSGTSWTEKLCGSVGGTAIGTNITITSSCTGKAVSLSNLAGAVTLIPPKGGSWNVSITDGVSCGLRFFDQSSYLGDSAGEARGFAVVSSSTSTNVEGLVCTDNNSKTGGGYYNLIGIAANDVAGDAIATGVCVIQNTNDTSAFDDWHCGVNTAVPAMTVFGACCSTHFNGDQLEANNVGTPLSIGKSSTLNSGISFADLSAVHPGSSYPAINFVAGTYAVEFKGTTYLEGPRTGSCSNYIQVATGGNIGGPIKFNSVTINSSASNYCFGSTAYLYDVNPSGNTVGQFQAATTRTGNLTNILRINGTGVIGPLSSANVTYPLIAWDGSFGANFLSGINVQGHLTQQATKNFAGTCAMSANATCNFTLTSSFSSTPVCVVTAQGTTAYYGACSVSGTTVTINANGNNSATWAAVVIGNPN